MAPVGYQEGSEKMWWWKVAMHIDEAQQALANAMAHNLDDQKPVFALQDRLREGQAILLDIFRSKGLLPVAPNGQNGQNGQHGSTNGIEEAIPVEPLPVMSEPAVPEHMIVDAELVSEDPVPAGVAEPPVTPAVVPAAAATKPSDEPLVVEVVAAVKPTVSAPAAAKPATKPSAPATPAAAAPATPASAPAAPAAAPAAGAPSTPSAEAPSEG